MHLILCQSQSAHTSNVKPMGKTISFQLSCRLDWISVGIFFWRAKILFLHQHNEAARIQTKQMEILHCLFFSLGRSMRLAIASIVCVWVNGASYFSSRARYFARFFLHRLPVIRCERSNKNSGFLFALLLLFFFSCPFLQMFQTNNFTTATVISQRTLARSCYGSNEPRAHTPRMDKWNNTCMGRAARGKRKTKGKVVCLVLGFLKSARKCHKFAFITHFCCWI